mmetsp:Transcript_836/g.2439  ORF Transcript_836/g.2439 Transcript_836/m.2439 type:complete len:421 (+) Transcript_836:157-1419(+)
MLRQQRVHKPRRGSGIGHGSADGVWSRPARDPPLHQLGRADRSKLVAAVGGVGGVRAAEAGRRQFEQRRRVAVVGSDAACARKPLTKTLELLAQAAHPLAVWPGLQRASSAAPLPRARRRRAARPHAAGRRGDPLHAPAAHLRLRARGLHLAPLAGGHRRAPDEPTAAGRPLHRQRGGHQLLRGRLGPLWLSLAAASRAGAAAAEARAPPPRLPPLPARPPRAPPPAAAARLPHLPARAGAAPHQLGPPLPRPPLALPGEGGGEPRRGDGKPPRHLHAAARLKLLPRPRLWGARGGRRRDGLLHGARPRPGAAPSPAAGCQPASARVGHAGRLDTLPARAAPRRQLRGSDAMRRRGARAGEAGRPRRARLRPALAAAVRAGRPGGGASRVRLPADALARAEAAGRAGCERDPHLSCGAGL